MPMHPPTDKELATLTHVTMTSDHPWDPSSFDTNVDTPQTSLIPQVDHDNDDDDQWELEASHFDRIQHSLAAFNSEIVVYKPKSRLPYKPDFQLLRPLFGWIPPARIRDTIRCTTQWYQADTRLPMHRHFKS